MSELAERIRAAVERRNRNEEAIASEGAIGVSHWPTTQERNELRVELSDLLHDNAPTILAGLAALESDPSATLAAKDAEIARLRAENEQLRWSLNGVSTCIDEIVDPSSPRAIKEFTRAKEFITAALADSADKQQENHDAT